MKVAVTVYQTIQIAHDAGKYVAAETRVFDAATTTLGEIWLWARERDRRPQWHDLVFSYAASEHNGG